MSEPFPALAARLMEAAGHSPQSLSDSIGWCDEGEEAIRDALDGEGHDMASNERIKRVGVALGLRGVNLIAFVEGYRRMQLGLAPGLLDVALSEPSPDALTFPFMREELCA